MFHSQTRENLMRLQSCSCFTINPSLQQSTSTSPFLTNLLELQGDDVLGHPRPILSVLHIFGEILLLTFISPCSHARYFIFTYLARVLM